MYFTQRGAMYMPTSEESAPVHKKLPPGNYALKFHPEIGYYFEPIAAFDLPAKLYGDSPSQTQRIMTTFIGRSSSTGVVLAGEIGSGKTLLAKMLGVACCNEGMPVIVVTEPICGGSFNQLVQGMSQECMFMFDEFEKTYDTEHQEKLLTLLDGAYNSKKLFVFTCNNEWKVDAHLHNRPGRIYYWLKFSGLSEAFIQEYCDDVLADKTQTEAICRLSGVFESINFDMLKAITEEMNFYGEDPVDALKMLNVRPVMRGGHDTYGVTAVGDRFTVDSLSQDECEKHPLSYEKGYRIQIMTEIGKLDEDGDEITRWDEHTLTAEDFVAANQETGELTFEFEGAYQNYKVTFKKKPWKPFSYDWVRDGERTRREPANLD